MKITKIPHVGRLTVHPSTKQDSWRSQANSNTSAVSSLVLLEANHLLVQFTPGLTYTPFLLWSVVYPHLLTGTPKLLFFTCEQVQPCLDSPTGLLFIVVFDKIYRYKSRTQSEGVGNFRNWESALGKLSLSVLPEEQTLRRLTFKCKVTKIVLVMSLRHMPVTQSIPYLIFSMCAATMHCKTTVDQNLKTICRFQFWHTCDLEIRARSSNLVGIARSQARL